MGAGRRGSGAQYRLRAIRGAQILRHAAPLCVLSSHARDACIHHFKYVFWLTIDPPPPKLFRSPLALLSKKQQAPKAVTTCALKDTSAKVASIAAAAAIAIAAPMVAPEEAFARDVAPYAGLTPCKKNAGFKKREKAEIKSLEKRLKKVRACVVQDEGGGAYFFKRWIFLFFFVPRDKAAAAPPPLPPLAKA